ncbi:MAG: DNA-directed DNA polymerase I [Candidatus Jordarchaeum sp.]|uniref:DNA-directed DNA polymerase I n=1 Tax=Candidatus Jordarchaeum sp. TaxID=2823881 RepID=UPI0040496BF5
MNERVGLFKYIQHEPAPEKKETSMKLEKKEEGFEETEEEEENDEEEEIEVEFGGLPYFCPENHEPGLVLSVEYDGKNNLAFARLYDPKNKRIFCWYDNTNHHPYCYTDLNEEKLKSEKKLINHEGFLGFEQVEKYDLLSDKLKKMTKIVANDPLSIGGKSNSIREILPKAWEARIRYHNNFIFDKDLIPGLFYRIEKGNIVPTPFEISSSIKKEMETILGENSEFEDVLNEFLPLFLTPAPDIRRAAVDIEVYSPIRDRIPDSQTAENKVISVSVISNEGESTVFVLKREHVETGDWPKGFPEDVKIEYFEDEAKMLTTVFKAMSNYPIILTFNGDNFDLRYLYNRATRLGMKKEEIPIVLTNEFAYMSTSIHIDLYRFFHNRSIQVYAFSDRYKEETLDAISKAILNVGKAKLDKSIHELSLLDLAYYCWWDSYVTLNLTQFDDNLVMKLIILLMRISRLSMEDLTRQGVSSWIKNLFYYEHRIRNYLIPLSEDINKMKGIGETKAIIKDKKFRGAIVVEPEAGVHFNVAVLDFASLYPSIIKEYNLSYETVRCPHPECKDNIVPETNHWVCKKRKGITSIIIGFLRDIRVKWFKPRSKDPSLKVKERAWNSIVERALKVYLNASYGVFGAEHFPFFCLPVAESTAAIGRYAIQKAITKAKTLGMNIIYGDTDSVFIKNPPEKIISELTNWSKKELGIDLELDKQYRYLALSERKKNYLGVFKDGTVDIKGLTGKKRNTPQFAQQAFLKMVDTLSRVESAEDFDRAKTEIQEIAKTCYNKIKNKEFSLEDFAFHVQISKPLKSYVKTTPQHVKAARMLSKNGKELKPGDRISFVKVRGKDGVRPVELANKEEIDTEKYKEYLKSTFEQVLDALGIDFDKIIGLTKLDLWV